MPTMTRAGYVPPQDGKAPVPPAGGKKPPKRKKRRRRGRNTAAVASLVIFLAAVFAGSATLYIYAQTEPYRDAFYPGTILSGRPLAGVSAQEGAKILAELTDESVASWRFDIEANGRAYALTAQDVALSVDVQATLDPLWRVGREGSMVMRYLTMLMARSEPVNAQPVLTYDMAPVDALLERIRADIECDPVDATVTFLPGNSEPFRFTQESVGLRVDTSALRGQIEAALLALTPGEAQLPIGEVKPAVYRAELEEAISLRARVNIRLVQDEASVANAAVAASRFDGLRIEPGEALSFNETVGSRTQEAGYAVADEPAYGPNVSGVGGGVCQVSTALYQAALLGGLQVDSRSAAVYPVAYCEMGQEAAVSEQGLDLVIVNSTDMPLFVTARVYADGDAHVLDMQLIGEPLQARYALSSQALETTTPEEPVYVRDSEGRYATYTDERVPVLEAMTGYSVLVERVTLDEQGQEIARETVSSETYAPIPQAIYVGVTEREQE